MAAPLVGIEDDGLLRGKYVASTEGLAGRGRVLGRDQIRVRPPAAAGRATASRGPSAASIRSHCGPGGVGRV